MVISSTTVKKSPYTGNGVTTAFAIGMPYFAQADIEVLVDDEVQTITTDYTISNGSYSVGHYVNGTVNFLSAPANGADILIRCNTTNIQTLDFSTLNTFDPAQIEPVFDKVALTVRDLERRVDDNEEIATEAATAAAVAAVQDLVDEAEASAAAALVSENAAAASASSASTSATTATTAKNLTLGYRDEAEDFRDEAEDYAGQAVTTANNLAATLTGNYILPSIPSVDGSNQFSLTSHMQARMLSAYKAILPTTGVDETYQAWICNGTNFSWASQSCKIISTVIPIEGLGTGTFDIDHEDGGELKIKYIPAKAKYVIEKIGKAGQA